jgi:hypothetical protein
VLAALTTVCNNIFARDWFYFFSVVSIENRKEIIALAIINAHQCNNEISDHVQPDTKLFKQGEEGFG